MDPQQELFTELLVKLRGTGYDVYDAGLPPDGTPYPFVYLGDSQATDSALKDAVFGSVYQTIHVWHNDPRQRGTVSEMLLTIKTACRSIRHTKNFIWNLKNVSQQVLPDNTTKSPLIHGVIEAEFNFY